MSQTFDVIIAGGGLNGLAMAMALSGRASRRPFSVMVIDRQQAPPPVREHADSRASAITATSRSLFETCGVWDMIAPHAEAIREIMVTDAKAPGVARPALLHFVEPGPAGYASAYMVENRHLIAALLAGVRTSADITLSWGDAIAGIAVASGKVQLRTTAGEELVCAMLIAADGRESPVRKHAAIETIGWAYRQSGIVTSVAHELPHHGRAEEHFLPAGPFAILPLPGNRSSIVWTEGDDQAKRLMALDQNDILVELQARFGTRHGDIIIDGPIQSYPLGMYLARSFVADRIALIGDAAHVVHPIAGLGFNLGLRDVAALAECLADAAAIGLDICSRAVLRRYEVWRRFDTVATALATDGLNRLFANDDSILRPLRDAGLMAVDALKPLKGFFMREAAGQTGQVPKLMRGEFV